MYGLTPSVWPAFSTALKNNRLTAPQQRGLARAMSVLKSTIWNMPVRHAGGGEFSVFAYDRADQTVTMPVEMWRELVLTGSWIQDATVLRWAELTEKLSGGDVPMSLVVEKLLSITDPDRETRDARTLYLSRGVTECVWSGRSIHEKLDVDHAIPFVLWHNNDLWNLFPARPDVNNAKRDLLPAQSVLQHRRDALIDCWEILHAAFPDRFLREAAGLCGGSIPAGNWKAPLFSRFAEAIEITATQRSVPRWDPNVRAGRRNTVVVPNVWGGGVPAAARFQPPETTRHEALLPGRMTGPEPAPLQGGRPNAGFPAAAATKIALLAYTDIQPHAFTRYLPLIGNLAAGPAFSGFEIGNLDHAAECAWIQVPEALCGKNRYLVRIAGDSMEPELHIGDLVVFEYHRTPRADGQIVVANLPALGITSDAATLDAVKRLLPDPHDWLFRSTNPVYEDLRIPKRECAYPILGVMVGRVDA